MPSPKKQQLEGEIADLREALEQIYDLAADALELEVEEDSEDS